MTVIRLHLFDQANSQYQSIHLALGSFLSFEQTLPGQLRARSNIGVVLEEGVNEGCDSGTLCQDNQNTEDEKSEQHGREPPPLYTPKK
jgi:hypothetical protein